MSAQIRDLLDGYHDRRTKWRKDTRSTILADQAMEFVDALLSAIQLRAFPVSAEEGSDDRTEQIVITVQGVDLSLRGRTGDLRVHIDSADRDYSDAVKYPLVVEVNNAGESDYPFDPQYIACQGRTCMFNARLDDLDAWEEHHGECPEVDDDGEPVESRTA